MTKAVVWFQNRFYFVLFVFAVFVALGSYVWRSTHRPPLFEMYIFNLDSAPAIFIRTKNDLRILIGGGSNSEIIKNLTKVLPFYSRRIDAVMVTKTDVKNSGGLIEIIRRYSVGKVYLPAVTDTKLGLASSTDAAYSELLNTAKLNATNSEEVKEGANFSLDSLDVVKFTVLFPTGSSSFEYSKASGPELSLLITYNGRSLLYLGAVSAKTQKWILNEPSIQGLRGKVDVLVMNQNIATSNVNKNFAKMLRPEFVIFKRSLNVKTTEKSKQADPFYAVPNDHRFNMQEKTVHIVIDGSSLRVE